MQSYIQRRGLNQYGIGLGVQYYVPAGGQVVQGSFSQAWADQDQDVTRTLLKVRLQRMILEDLVAGICSELKEAQARLREATGSDNTVINALSDRELEKRLARMLRSRALGKKTGMSDIWQAT